MTLTILIDSRTDRTAATRIMDGLGVPQNDRTYFSRTAAVAEFGNDDARYVVTTHPVLVHHVQRRCESAGLTVI